MGEPKTTRWLITGRGHWLMAIAAWIMSVVAGMRIEEATKRCGLDRPCGMRFSPAWSSGLRL